MLINEIISSRNLCNKIIRNNKKEKEVNKQEVNSKIDNMMRMNTCYEKKMTKKCQNFSYFGQRALNSVKSFFKSHDEIDAIKEDVIKALKYVVYILILPFRE